MAEISRRATSSAADSALGYLYQVRAALLSSIKRLGKDEEFSLYLETLEDVVFDVEGSPLELLQLKHRRGQAANLTDSSPDLWKSLRNWIEGRSQGTIPMNARLVLMTTSAVGSGSAASKLVPEERDETGARACLDNVVATSRSEENKAAYQMYSSLSPAEKLALVSTIEVAPHALDISGVADEIRAEVRHAVRRNHVEAFLARLEGWWFGRSVGLLIAESPESIKSFELEGIWHDLREQFRDESLPIDPEISSQSVDAAAYVNHLFVRQLDLAGIGSKRVELAARDYFRAFAQRSKWMREELLLVGELDNYERLLHEEWEIQFHRFSEGIDNQSSETDMCQAASRVYAWAEESAYLIRQSVQLRSMSRGSLHILADRLKVGWHPQFDERLRHLLPLEAEPAS